MIDDALTRFDRVFDTITVQNNPIFPAALLRRRNFSVKEAYSLDMEIMQAKELVVRAGKQLVESGLIART